jgi:hypothetical protein
MLRPTIVPKKVSAGDLIISFDSQDVGVLRYRIQSRLTGRHNEEPAAYWCIHWLKGPRQSWPLSTEPDQYRDSDLRSEIAAGYWHWFPAED